MKKLKDLKQTHGKLEGGAGKFDSILKYKSVGRNAFTEEELQVMDIKNLYLLATNIGIVPIDNKNLLITRLLKEMSKM
jgi:hypothetical protein